MRRFLILLARLAVFLPLSFAQCPFGQLNFNNFCYAISPTKSRWLESERQCEGAGGFLTSIMNGFERNAILGRRARVPHRQYWADLRKPRSILPSLND